MSFKRINEGELLPPWYGCAWHDWQANQMVCLPIGLNLFASFIRACYFTLKHGGKWMRDNPRAAFAPQRQETKLAPDDDCVDSEIPF